jgi:acyl carrier protein
MGLGRLIHDYNVRRTGNLAERGGMAYRKSVPALSVSVLNCEQWKGRWMDVGIVIGIDAVKAVVVETLGVEDRADTLDASTPLLETLPELDSMAVLELVLELEERFGITVEGEDVTAEVFETLGSLTAFVESKAR